MFTRQHIDQQQPRPQFLSKFTPYLLICEIERDSNEPINVVVAEEKMSAGFATDVLYNDGQRLQDLFRHVPTTVCWLLKDPA